MSADPLDRRGHLSEWALERLRVDDPASDAAFFAAANAHLAACEPCTTTFEGMQAEAPSLTMAPRVATVMPLRPRASKSRLLAGIGALAAAALVLIVAWPRGETGTGIVAKGAHLELEVYVKSSSGAALASDGSVVHPGDQLAFKARAEASGHLAVFGWDDARAPYPVLAPIPFAATKTSEQLGAAIALDAKGTSETLAAIWCAKAFVVDDFVRAPVDEPALRSKVSQRDCSLRIVRLTKKPR